MSQLAVHSGSRPWCPHPVQGSSTATLADHSLPLLHAYPAHYTRYTHSPSGRYRSRHQRLGPSIGALDSIHQHLSLLSPGCYLVTANGNRRPQSHPKPNTNCPNPNSSMPSDRIFDMVPDTCGVYLRLLLPQASLTSNTML